MREVTIGLIQFEAALGDTMANTEKACGMIQEAAQRGANIVCLPETFVTGYDLGVYDTPDKFYEIAEPPDGPTVHKLQIIAGELGIYLIAGLALRGKEPPQLDNAVVFIDKNGDLGSVYFKNHLFGPEKKYFSIHNQYYVYNTEFGKVGIMCCYDANFPEPARILTLMGAELIFHPAAWRVNDADVWHCLLSARACENMVFIASCNTWGRVPNRFTFGHSKVVDPRGTVIAESGKDGEDILICTIDLDEIAHKRNEINYLNDINPTQYERLSRLIHDIN